MCNLSRQRQLGRCLRQSQDGFVQVQPHRKGGIDNWSRLAGRRLRWKYPSHPLPKVSWYLPSGETALNWQNPRIHSHKDAPVGVRLATEVSAFPSGINTVATFNRDLIYQRAVAMGAEFKGKGIGKLNVLGKIHWTDRL